jgi:hypothetical protein
MVLAVWLIASGWTDSDWQMVTYRYSAWHRSVVYWEYNPFLKVNWWLAWQLDILRFTVGSAVIGFLINEFRWRTRITA